ncbi:MBL fold metallo-hydrolase [candidate division WOR-3 bacterium]|nr:MBL fold metallo-hydrolase [candidate division WOR-3 bacterium]
MADDAVKLVVAYDNRTLVEGLEPDWGFACAVTRGADTLLFDTGAKPGILKANLAALGFDSSGFDAVVISHDHWDHNGGLEAALGDRHGRCWLPASASEELVARVTAAGAEPVPVSGRLELLPGIWTTGEIAGNPAEQALVVETADGPVVVTGCAHPGVVSICRVVGEQFGMAPALVIGGFHLREPGPEQGRVASAELKELGVARVGPSHCTGADAQAVFAEEWGERCERVGCGWTGEWEAR